MSTSALKSTTMRGPLYHQGMGSRGSQKSKKSFVFALNLTALIDAFSILVIFLLSNFNGDAQNINVSSKITLPTVTQSELMTMGTVIRIDGAKFYIDEKEIAQDQIASTLVQMKQDKKDQTDEIQHSLIIQADRSLDFQTLSPIIRAGGQAGFNQYKFAVLPKGQGK